MYNYTVWGTELDIYADLTTPLNIIMQNMS